MLDNQLIALVISIIKTGLTGLDLGVVIGVKQAYQPTQQGTPVENTVLLHKIGDHRYGYPLRKDEWIPDTDGSGVMTHTESQWYETTFQIDALAIQSPSNVTSLTASDIVNYVAAILQSDTALGALKAQGVGILRITEIRNVPFVDDRDRFEYHPSFDFTLTHEQVIISESPVISIEDFNIARV